MARKLYARLAKRFTFAVRRHRPLIAVLAAIAVIAAAATFISIRLDASPRPSGAPPVDIPSPSTSQLPRLASGTWPTTRPEAAPANCKKVNLKGTAGASVVSFLDDNVNQQDLVAEEARGLRLIDFSWTSLASPTDVAQTDSFDPSLETELAVSSQSAPCGLRFATLSDNDPGLSHSGRTPSACRDIPPSVRRSPPSQMPGRRWSATCSRAVSPRQRPRPAHAANDPGTVPIPFLRLTSIIPGHRGI
jgi:hypothetical protein